MARRKRTPHDDWITLDEAAALLGCGRTTVRRLVDDGELTYRQPTPRNKRVLRSEVLARLEPQRGVAS